YGLLAAGHVDLVVENSLKLYDFAALVAVIKGAGGLITDWAGKELDINSDGSVLAAGDPAIHRAASKVLNSTYIDRPKGRHGVGCPLPVHDWRSMSNQTTSLKPLYSTRRR